MHYIIIMIGAALSYIVIRRVYDAHGEGITAAAFGRCLGFEFVLVCTVVVAAAAVNKNTGSPVMAFLGMALFVILWLPSMILLAVMGSDFFLRVFAGFSVATRNPDVRNQNRHGSVRAFLWEENPNAAMKACLGEFDKYPDDYEILMENAALFSGHGYHDQALYLYLRVINLFSGNTAAWPPATFHAAVIYRDHLDNQEKAYEMFRQLAENFPDKDIGMIARERMNEASAAQRSQIQTPEQMSMDAEDAPPPDPFHRRRIPSKPMEDAPDEIPVRPLSKWDEEMRGFLVDEESPS